MKKALLGFALLLTSATLFADTTTTRSYLVGTRHAARFAVGTLARGENDFEGRHRVRTFDLVDAFQADLSDDEVAALKASPEVRYVELDVPRYAFGKALHTAGTELRNPVGQTIPYGVTLVKAPSVWSVTKGAGINVAILDTGIDIHHPDLQTAYAGGFNTYFGSKNPTEPQDPIDDDGHGTHVSGTVAATDNNIGVVGVAPGVRLWMVRVLRSDGQGGASGSSSNIVSGLQWVVQQKQAKGGDWIISMSLGSCQPSNTESNAISAAINAGVLVVAAAGNHDPTQPDTCGGADSNSYEVSYPAAYPGVVAVGAVDKTSTIADFSNTGPQVAIAAPGVSVLSTVPVGHGALAAVASAGGTLTAAELTGSPFGSQSGKIVDCGLGKGASDFPAAVKGNIALIKRGDVTFAAKVKNAQAAGASAVVIYNKDTSELAFTLTGDAADAGHVWPVTVAVSLADGETLLGQAGSNVTVSTAPDDYDSYQGTSMATPHVAAVAALAWSVAPAVTAETVKQALYATAHDLGATGPDSLYGNGLVNALDAAKQLNPAAFGSPVTSIPPSLPPEQAPIVGRMPGRRGH